MSRFVFPPTVAILALSVPLTAQAQRVDLLITNPRVLDVRTGTVHEPRALTITGDLISGILGSGDPLPAAHDTLDAAGRLLTPGLIDVHHHLDYLLGDSISAGGGFITHLTMEPDSISRYRRRFARAYLPYGVTTVRDAGDAEENLPLLVSLLERSPDSPTFFAVGGALVSREEGRTPFPGHAVVTDSADAAGKVREYHRLGLRHIKLYWRLREPELRGAFLEAQRLGMTVTAHIDFKVVPFETVLDLGVRQFEHAYTVGVAALTDDEYRGAWRRLAQYRGEAMGSRFYAGVMEYFNVLGPDNARMGALIDRLAATRSIVSTTLHIFAQRWGLAHFSTPSFATFDDTSDFTEEQMARVRRGYRILADYVRDMHERGVTLTVGTDWADPGRAVLSEMLLLYDLGIPMEDVFRIATLNGAVALGIERDVGNVEVGKRADLVLFDANPLADPQALLGGRTVVKDGLVASRGR